MYLIPMVSCTLWPYERPLLLSPMLAVFQSEVAGHVKSRGEGGMKLLPAAAAVEAEVAVGVAF